MSKNTIDTITALPQEVQPKEWQDDERMGFLMSAFKVRALNPKSWDAKMRFWTALIEDYCLHCKVLVIDEATLKRSFERNGTLPACLGIVLESLQKSSSIVSLEDVKKSGYHGQSWGSWMKDTFLASPTNFAVSSLWSALGYDNTTARTQTQKFIFVPALKAYAEEMLDEFCPDNNLEHSSSPILLLSDVLKKAPNKQNADLAIMWLCRNSQACVDDSGSPVLVKFGPNSKILDLDRKTITLKLQEESLKRKLCELEEGVENKVKEAKDYLSKGMRSQAKSSLREKKTLERRAAKLSESLSNLHGLISQLQDSESNAQVINAYQNASAALKAVFKETGLGEDNVANTMDDLEDVLDLHNEVETMIATPVGPAATISSDDAEFENELAELLNEADDAGPPDGGTGAFDIHNLPNVPSSPIGGNSLLVGTQQ